MTLDQIVQESFARASDMDLGVKDWADKADLCWQTIQRIADGTTQNPHWKTVERMTRVVGLVLVTQHRIKHRRVA